ncbi:hypothetical protein PH210_12770 [Paenibacillus sp. BSR1-1]|uniref:hypothetical protein n=1 Tax=Paenibacillus sp. BSR1-1 TaxID=3020845 RepID=UPI0025AFFFA2|nr:hypothetical protein [Paenibacillus sp. BSR1-1]MDN3017065.1 hypothetical protein [Paenibacillus sp. BSR1-1]
MTSKNQRIHMGEHTIDVKSTKEGSVVASLSSGLSFKVLEMEKTSKGEIRLKEMELGSAHISSEHLAILLHHSNLADDVLNSLEKVRQLMTKTVDSVQLGNRNIVVTANKNGSKTAKLNSGNSFGVIEMEKTTDGIRLKEMEAGSAYLTSEEFAAVLFYADLDKELESEIKKVKEFYGRK